MRIGFLLRPSEIDHSTPINNQIFDILRSRNVEIEAVVPSHHQIDLSKVRVTCDLYVLKPGLDLSLSLAGILHDKGAQIINSFPASSYIQDKARVTAALYDAGIPVPPSYFTDSCAKVCDILENCSIIVKPHRGTAGEGIFIHNCDSQPPSDLGNALFVQKFLHSDGEDIKIYVIGEDVFAIKRPFPALSYAEKLGKPYPLNNEMRDIALRCGRIFGLEIYGIDVLQTSAGFFVIDVNYFPGMIGVPDVAERLADYIYYRALSRSAPQPAPILPRPYATANVAYA